MNITNVQQLTNEPWLNLFAANYEHAGHQGRWIFSSRRSSPGGLHCDAVIIVPILRNPGEPARLVMIREYRVPVGGVVHGLPAGLVDEGETVETTIHREIREETGYTVTAIHRVTQPLYSSCGMTDEAVALAFIDVQGHPDATQALEASEQIEVLLLDHAAVCRLCDDATVAIDAKAWQVLYLYRLLGKL